MTASDIRNPRQLPGNAMMLLSQARRALIWAVLAAIVALLCVMGFRGYLSSDLLLNFASMIYC